jgi:hypothetical protein
MKKRGQGARFELIGGIGHSALFLFGASLFKNTENREFFTAIFLSGVKQNTLTGEKVSGIISVVGSVKALTFT